MRQMADGGYRWLIQDPPEGRLESVYGYVCVCLPCLFWLSVRSTPTLLYGPIGPSLAYGSVICHVGMCADDVSKQRGRFKKKIRPTVV